MNGFASQVPCGLVRRCTPENSAITEVQYEEREEHSGQHERFPAPATAENNNPQQTRIARQPDACCIFARDECLLHRPSNQGHHITVVEVGMFRTGMGGPSARVGHSARDLELHRALRAVEAQR